MSSLNEFTYPYNPNGVMDECNIIGETHTITPSTDRNYNWFVPFAAPFFGFSVVLKHVASGKTLQRGVDYNLGLEYHVFNTQISLRPVYGAIILIDTALTGQFTIDYMTIGGQYAIDQNKALALVANALLDPRSTYWENVTDIPSQFPVTSHLHNVSDVTGMADVVQAIVNLTAGFTDSGGKWWQALAEHLNDFDDPHHVLDMIPGGGSGQAVPKATYQQAIQGTDDTAYMTSLRVAQQIANGVAAVINAHISATGNVHGLTAADINLGNVVNLPMATQSDYDGNSNQGYYANLSLVKYVANAIATAVVNAAVTNNFATQTDAVQAVSTTTIMSPLRVAQQIAAGVGAMLQQHLDATGNVHNLVAADINLGNVVNLPMATQADYDGNTNPGYYANLALTKYVASAITNAAIAANITNNFASQQEAIDGENTTKFMSSLRVAQQIDAGVGKALSDHVAAKGNVHDLSADDLGLGNVPNYPAATKADIDNTTNLDSSFTTPDIVQYIVGGALANAGLGSFVTASAMNSAITSAFSDIASYPVATAEDILGVSPPSSKLATAEAVSGALLEFGFTTILGVCVTPVEKAAYLAQTTLHYDLVDVAGNQVYTYDAATGWTVNSSKTLADVLLVGRLYFNPVTFGGFKCDTAGTVIRVAYGPQVTVSDAPPPSDVTGYADGFVWYQIS